MLPSRLQLVLNHLRPRQKDLPTMLPACPKVNTSRPASLGASFFTAPPRWRQGYRGASAVRKLLLIPGKVLFAERHIQHAFLGQDVHGQAALPKRHTEKQFAPAVQVE
jgi:hypothetical protein